MLTHLKQSVRGWKKQQKLKHMPEEKAVIQRQSERQIDETLEDSFPASDPPAWY